MIVTLYGPMEGKAKFSGLPGGAVGGGGEGMAELLAYRGDATTDCSEGMSVIWVVHVPTPTYISLTWCLGAESGL